MVASGNIQTTLWLRNSENCAVFIPKQGTIRTPLPVGESLLFFLATWYQNLCCRANGFARIVAAKICGKHHQFGVLFLAGSCAKSWKETQNYRQKWKIPNAQWKTSTSAFWFFWFFVEGIQERTKWCVNTLKVVTKYGLETLEWMLKTEWIIWERFELRNVIGRLDMKGFSVWIPTKWQSNDKKKALVLHEILITKEHLFISWVLTSEIH